MASRSRAKAKPDAWAEALRAVGFVRKSAGDCSGTSAPSQDVTSESLVSSSSLVSTKDKAKAKPKPRAKKRVKLKPTTRAMLNHAKFMRGLYPHGRDSHARIYREGRRLGRSNLSILDLIQPTAEEKAKREAEEWAEIEAAAAEQAAKGELSPDSALYEVLPKSQGEGSVVEEHDSTSPPTLTARPRRLRVEPQKRQATFSFGTD